MVAPCVEVVAVSLKVFPSYVPAGSDSTGAATRVLGSTETRTFTLLPSTLATLSEAASGIVRS